MAKEPKEASRLIHEHVLKYSTVLDTQKQRHGLASSLLIGYEWLQLWDYKRIHGSFLELLPEIFLEDFSQFKEGLFESFGNFISPRSGTIMNYEMKAALEHAVGSEANPFMPLQHMFSYIRDLLMLEKGLIQELSEEFDLVDSKLVPVVASMNAAATGVKFDAFRSKGSKYLLFTPLEGLRSFQAKALIKFALQLISRAGYKVSIKLIKGLPHLVVDYDLEEINDKPFVIKKTKEEISKRIYHRIQRFFSSYENFARVQTLGYIISS